jgi:hypothetical protein
MKKKLLHFSVFNAGVLNVAFSAFAITLGGLIYIFFRPSEHVFFKWINLPRDIYFFHSLPLPEWIVFSLPNGFWAFAYALLITHIWSGSRSWLRYFWMSSIPLLVLGFEMLQQARILAGTFCMQDIVLGILGLLLGIIVGIKISKSNNYEKSFN